MLDIEFLKHVALLLALLFGFTIFKIVNCKPFNEQGEDFQLKQLILGTCKHLIIIIGVCAVYYVSNYCGEALVVVKIGETNFAIHDALNLIIMSIIGVYGVKFIKNLATYFGIETSNIQPVESQTKEEIQNIEQNYIDKTYPIGIVGDDKEINEEEARG